MHRCSILVRGKYKKENPFLQAKAGNSQWRRNFKNKAYGSNRMD